MRYIGSDSIAVSEFGRRLLADSCRLLHADNGGLSVWYR